MHRSCISWIQVNCKYCSHCRHHARKLQITDISPEFRSVFQSRNKTNSQHKDKPKQTQQRKTSRKLSETLRFQKIQSSKRSVLLHDDIAIPADVPSDSLEKVVAQHHPVVKQSCRISTTILWNGVTCQTSTARSDVDKASRFSTEPSQLYPD